MNFQAEIFMVSIPNVLPMILAILLCIIVTFILNNFYGLEKSLIFLRNIIFSLDILIAYVIIILKDKNNMRKG